MYRLLLPALDRQLQSESRANFTDFEVLVHLSEAPKRRLRMSELADRTISTRSAITRTVDRLVAREWVRRVRSADDQRGFIGRNACAARVACRFQPPRLGSCLLHRLHKGLDEIFINGSVEHRLPHSLNISFAYVEGESLLMGINDVAVSSGSACTSASLEPSYVLKALGAGDDLAHSSIRFGLGRWSTEEEVDYVADKLITVVTRLREMSPLYELAKEGVDLSTMQWETH